MEIKYFVREQWGRFDRYIADENIAQAYFLITGKKVLTDKAIEGLKALGHTLTLVEEVTIIK